MESKRLDRQCKALEIVTALSHMSKVAAQSECSEEVLCYIILGYELCGAFTRACNTEGPWGSQSCYRESADFAEYADKFYFRILVNIY